MLTELALTPDVATWPRRSARAPLPASSAGGNVEVGPKDAKCTTARIEPKRSRGIEGVPKLGVIPVLAQLPNLTIASFELGFSRGA